MSRKWRLVVSTFFVAIFSILSINIHDVAAASPKDIPARSAAEINYLLSRGIIEGYPDGRFQPKNSVTREEAVTMVGRAIGLDGTKRETAFSDVSATSFGSGYIESARQQGFIPDGSKFRPKNKMTRGEMALLLQRAFGLVETSGKSFSDIPASGELATAVNRLATAGIAGGYPDGTFGPNRNMTREEFSLFVARSLNESYRAATVDEKQTPSPGRSPISEATVNVAASDSLNVRSGPNASSSIITSLKDGTKVSIYWYEGEWAYITSSGVTGYVNKYYLIQPSNGTNIVAIDPGHGGSDPGAIGVGGLMEKELNLSVSLKVEKLLKEMGYTVVMTRRGDTYPSLTKRVDIAEAAKADAFVSIHGNAASASASGTETFYSTASRASDSKQLATFIQKRLVPALGTKDRGVKTGNFLVIHRNSLPSALVELGFLSNSSDAAKLSSDEYRNKAAEAIALGIQDYFNWKK